MIEPARLLGLLLNGYLATVAVEAPVLCRLLSKRHPLRRRIAAGLWLTACSYPIVVVVMPPLFSPDQYWQYVVSAEIFAPASECLLFWLVYLRNAETDKLSLSPSSHSGNRAVLQDMLAIVIANLLSCAVGFLLMWLKIKLA